MSPWVPGGGGGFMFWKSSIKSNESNGIYLIEDEYNFLSWQPKHIESIVIVDSLNNLIKHPGYNLQTKDQLVDELENGSEEIINNTILGHNNGSVWKTSNFTESRCNTKSRFP